MFEAPGDEIEAAMDLAAKVIVEAPEPAIRIAVPPIFKRSAVCNFENPNASPPG